MLFKVHSYILRTINDDRLIYPSVMLNRLAPASVIPNFYREVPQPLHLYHIPFYHHN